MLCRDFNARVGKQPTEKILGTNGTLNENEKHLINFATLNGFKITNTFLDTREFISIRGVPEARNL